MGKSLFPVPFCTTWPTEMKSAAGGIESQASYITGSFHCWLIFISFPKDKQTESKTTVTWMWTYGAISKSALRTKLVLHCHFSDNERRERLWQSKQLRHGMSFPEEQGSAYGLSFMIWDHILKKVPANNFLSRKQHFWKASWQYINSVLKISKSLLH